MRIVKMVCAPCRSGYFFDDQVAIREGAEPDGFTYRGSPRLPGFSSIRQAGESVSILLLLEDGQIAHGDCAAVQYSGAGGRDPLFLAEKYIPFLERVARPRLEGREITSFRDLAEELDTLTDPATGHLLHSALRYGLTQAVLDAAAKARGRLMAEIVAEEYGLSPSWRAVPIFTQSGDERRLNADKMIIKGADVLPHGLINEARTKLGIDGGLLLDYVGWLKQRLAELKPRADYCPVIHLDVYGTIGEIFAQDESRILDYLARLAEKAAPYRLRVEGPVDLGSRQRQLDALRRLTNRVDALRIPVEIVADEWCNDLRDIKEFADQGAGHMLQIKTPDLGGVNNSIEAVKYCKDKGVGAYLGGTSNETDRSAQICVHIALATEPTQMLAKPGMGVDEGFMIVYNEMQRALAILRAR